MSRSTLLRIVGPWIAVALLAGCAPDADVLARVGGATIRAEDFLEAARDLRHPATEDPDSARVRVLEDLVRRELLVQGALREGLYRDSTFLDYRRRVEDQLLRGRLAQELGGGPVPVSQAEVEEFYRWRAQEAHCNLIFTLTPEAARAALQQIRGGADFAEVANRFNPAGVMPPGGDIGFVVPGSLDPALDALLRTAPLGEVIGPIEAPGQGWFLMRIDERLPRAQPALEGQREALAEMLRQRKQREVLLRAALRLKRSYDIAVRRGAPQEIVVRFLAPEHQETGPPPLTEGERATVLADYHGGVYTLGDALDDLMSGATPRPNLQFLPTVERWLESRVLDRAVLLEARRRRYQDEPAVQRAVRSRSNDYLLDGYYAREVLGRVLVRDEDVREQYRRDPELGVQVSQATVLVATLRDSTAAAQLADRARQAGGLREAAPGVPVRQHTVRYPTDQPIWGLLEPELHGLAPGACGGPFAAPEGWMVIQLVAKTQGRPPLDRLTPEARQYLEYQVRERLRDERLFALLDSLRRTIPVAVYPERLKRLPWPPGAAARASGG